MEWAALFDMQQKLDTYIEQQHGLEKKDLFEKKILALFVELGELANETRCFKFWSNKAANEKAIILEEYVDNIHFIMSLGLNKGLTFSARTLPTENGDLTTQFNEVFALVLTFQQNPEQTAYESLFIQFLLLGKMLGFSETDIQNAYYEKNKINFARQDEGY